MSKQKQRGRLAPLVRGVSESLRAVGEVGIVSMMLIVIADVAMRSIFNAPILGTLEVVTYWCMVTVSFVGMWLAQKRNEQISVTMLTDRFSAQGQLLHRLFGNLLTFLFLLAVGWYGWSSALDNMARGEFTGATHVLIWPMRFLVPIGMLAFIITLVIQTVDEFRQTHAAEEDDDISIGTQL